MGAANQQQVAEIQLGLSRPEHRGSSRTQEEPTTMCTQQGPWNPVAPIGIHWHPVGSGGILGSRDTVDLLRQQRVEPNGTQRDLVGSNGIRWDPCIQGHPGSNKTAAGRGNSVGSVWPTSTMDPEGLKGSVDHLYQARSVETSGIQWDPLGSNGIRWDPWIQGLCTYSAGSVD